MRIEELKFKDEQGLVPVVVQDADTKEVLMLAYANPQALRLTMETGRAHFWSRSRQRLWLKGEESGNYQDVVEVRADCDGDAVLYLVHPKGPACHTGAKTCFHNTLKP
ncbi:MAG: phosphoribosyl-AMP cyclohydrolase [Candidatus Caldarchaeum sp.]